jgi:hypothetical protein
MNDDRTFQTVDESTFGMFQINLYDHIKVGKVIPKPCKFEDFKGTELADFIFIDGDHSYGSVKHDINKAVSLIKPGGVICGHDYHWRGVKEAVDEMFLKEYTKTVDSIWWVRV